LDTAEARAERALSLATSERIPEEVGGLLDARRRVDVHHRRRGRAVDLVDRHPLALSEGDRRRGTGNGVLTDDGRAVTELSHRGRTAERNAATEQGDDEEPSGAAPETEEVLHSSFLAAAGLTHRCGRLRWH